MYDKEYIKKYHRTNKHEYKGNKTSKSILHLAKKYIKGKTLDAGAGDGALITYFKKMFPDKKVVGIDLVPKSKIVMQGDITNLTFKDNSFEVCIMTDVVEHLDNQDLKKALSETVRVVKNQGYIIITTKNNEDLESKFTMCPSCHYYFHRVGHQQIFKPDRLDKLMKKQNSYPKEIQLLNLTFTGMLHPFGVLLYKFGIMKILSKIFNQNKKLIYGDIFAVYQVQKQPQLT